MTRMHIGLAAALTLGLWLGGCSKPSEESESLDDFAARLDAPSKPSGQASEVPQTAPATATPLPGAAPIRAPFEPGTATDPKAASCGATKAAAFLSRPYAEGMEAEIARLIPKGASVRVVPAGAMITQDHRPQRLNLMLDAGGIIRDLRCG